MMRMMYPMLGGSAWCCDTKGVSRRTAFTFVARLLWHERQHIIQTGRRHAQRCFVHVSRVLCVNSCAYVSDGSKCNIQSLRGATAYLRARLQQHDTCRCCTSDIAPMHSPALSQSSPAHSEDHVRAVYSICHSRDDDTSDARRTVLSATRQMQHR